MKIKHVKIKDFKGIKAFDKDFYDKTVILGDNGSGKTSILDAVSWCFHGKTLDDKKKFSIIPLKSDGTEKKVKPEVSVIIEVNGKETELKRKMGSSSAEVYINGAKKKIHEFEEWIEENVTNIGHFKLFSDPLFFPSLPRNDQREVFLGFFDEPSTHEVVESSEKNLLSNDDFSKYLNDMSPEDVKSMARAAVKESGGDLDRAEAKIEYIEESIDSLSVEKDAQIGPAKRRRKEIVEKISSTQDSSADYHKYEDETEELVGKGFSLHRELEQIDRAVADIQKKHNREKEHIREDAKYLHKQVLSLENETVETICPACGQDIPEASIAKAKESVANMVEEKKRKIEELRKEYEKPGPDLSEYKTKAGLINNELKDLNKRLAHAQVKAHEEKEKAKSNDIVSLQNELSSIDKILAGYDRAEKLNTDLKEWRDKAKAFAQNYEKYEKIEKAADDFIMAKTDLFVSKTEKHFKTIKVQLFRKLRNGNIEPHFEIMKDGVPYADLNRTGKLAAGLEFLKCFKDQSGLEIPVIIDNFESYPSLKLALLDGAQVIVTKVIMGQEELICQQQNL